VKKILDNPKFREEMGVVARSEAER